MSRPNPFVLFVVLLLTGLAAAGLILAKGALLISAHEGDTYHLLDILIRMTRGEMPHEDFMTPLGILAFLPISTFIQAGYGAGHAIIYAQILVAAILLPAIWYAAHSRLTARTAYLFGAFTITMVLAVSFGGTLPGLSISMHYNRWAWAIGFVVLLLVLAPPRGRARPRLDGVLLGLAFSAFVFVKITYFVALLPGVALVLLLENRRAELVTALATGGTVAILATLILGPGFWLGYASDLAAVAGSEVRPNAGKNFGELVAAPQNIAAIALGFAVYYLLSRTGERAKALGFVVLFPGFLYIAYQNYGNDPKWLAPLAAVLIALRPAPRTRYLGTHDANGAYAAAAIVALVLFLPSAVTIMLSPLRHFARDESNYSLMLPGWPQHDDIRVRTDRAYTTMAEVDLDRPGSVWAPYRAIAERSDPPTLGGVAFYHCRLVAGLTAYMVELAEGLAEAGVAEGSRVFVVDMIPAVWLFGPYRPLEGGAPWYYGALSGIESADVVVVPKCNVQSEVRDIILGEIAAADLELTLLDDNELFALYAVGQPASSPATR